MHVYSNCSIEPFIRWRSRRRYLGGLVNLLSSQITIYDYDSVGSENQSGLNKDLKSDLSGLDANRQLHINRLVATLRHSVVLY